MFYETLGHLACPALAGRCGAKLDACDDMVFATSLADDIESGHLVCTSCGHRFPIIGGVAILVENIRAYVSRHIRDIRQTIADACIPPDVMTMMNSLDKAPATSLEADLESNRIDSWYTASHYLTGEEVVTSQELDPVFRDLIRTHWDGPRRVLNQFFSESKSLWGSCLDLGCGVGGAVALSRRFCRFSLGVDKSFKRIFTARAINFHPGLDHSVKLQADLLDAAPITLKLPSLPHKPENRADFVVANIVRPPVASDSWDVALSLNVMDTLADPGVLPEVQARLLRSGGTVINSCPYVWSPQSLIRLRERLPQGMTKSTEAVEYLYSQNGFAVRQVIKHVPWLFLKHARQIELYSAHVIVADKGGQSTQSRGLLSKEACD